jgi:hypothetical protein
LVRAYIAISKVSEQIQNRVFNRPLAHNAKLELVKAACRASRRNRKDAVKNNVPSLACSPDVPPGGACEGRKLRGKPTRKGNNVYKVDGKDIIIQTRCCYVYASPTPIRKR